MLKKYSNIIFAGLILLIYFLIFRNWFSLLNLSANDWPYLYPDVVKEIVPFASWDILFNYGFGQSSLSRLWFDAYALTIVKLANLLSWPIFERVIWFFPSIIISFFAAFFLSKKFISSFKFNLISGLIYSANTYFLMIASGGQVGVMFAYAFLPIPFITLYELINSLKLKKSLIFSLSLAILCMLDLRVGYMFLVCQAFIVLIQVIFESSKFVKKIVNLFVIPGIVVVILHSFWILPVILSHQSPVDQLSDIYTSVSSLDFFGFAKLENTIGLLHPNWPENIFGKVSFLRPEFLIVSIMAFLSLLFVNKETKQRKIHFLSIILLSIIGIFLAKGTNDPFGQIYSFLFDLIPGFVMFRDPTKWYMIIAIGFSILIPYSLFNLSEKINKYNLPIIIPFLFVIFWVFLIRDSMTGVVRGTLTPRQIPVNYISLANFLSNDKSYARTLWVPAYPSFAYVSYNHPAAPAREYFEATSSSDLINKLTSKNAKKILTDSAIKYVIVPEDTFGKIFLTDRKYDEKEYQAALREVEQLPYLTKVKEFGKIKVFELQNPKSHFWINNSSSTVKVSQASPTSYKVSFDKPTDKLVFVENYDKLWSAESANGNIIPSEPFKVGIKTFNSFDLEKSEESNTYLIEYNPQKWVYVGMVISGIGLIIVIVLIMTRKK